MPILSSGPPTEKFTHQHLSVLPQHHYSTCSMTLTAILALVACIPAALGQAVPVVSPSPTFVKPSLGPVSTFAFAPAALNSGMPLILGSCPCRRRPTAPTMLAPRTARSSTRLWFPARVRPSASRRLARARCTDISVSSVRPIHHHHDGASFVPFCVIENRS